jgi:hypothetical protein
MSILVSKKKKAIARERYKKIFDNFYGKEMADKIFAQFPSNKKKQNKERVCPDCGFTLVNQHCAHCGYETIITDSDWEKD